MKKQKSKFIVNNSSNEYRPELFNFLANQGKSISLILKNENVRIGRLLGLNKNNSVLLEIGTTLSETRLFDVSEIIVLDN
ncbi:MAG TPA: hypothetical protein VIK55_14080 [Paludibacter sp.]